MAVPKFNKRSFNGGVVDERLWWRSDTSTYQNGCKELNNMIVEPWGSVKKRQGFAILDVITPLYTTDDMSVIPYDINSDTDAYYFVLNGNVGGSGYSTKLHLSVASVVDGNTISIDDTEIGASEYQQWTAPDFKQVGVDVYLVDPNNPPLLLKLQSDGNISATKMPLTGGPFQEENTNPSAKMRTAFAGDYEDTNVAVESNFDIFIPEMVGTKFKFRQVPDETETIQSYTGAGTGTVYNFNTSPIVALGEDVLTFTTTGFWQGKVQVQKSTDDGSSWETIYTHTSSGDNLGEVVNITTVLNASEVHSIYRLKGTVNGTPQFFLTADFSLQNNAGKMDAWGTITAYTDARNVTMDMEQYAVQDNVYTDEWSQGSFTVDTWPRTIALFEERLYFGGTSNEPQTIWGSVLGDWFNFSPVGSLVTEEDSLTVRIAAERRDDIKWLTSRDAMHVGTTSSEWIFGSRSSDRVTSGTNLQAQKQDDVGSGTVKAVTGAGMTMFVNSDNTEVYGLMFSYENDIFASTELSLKARSILEVGIKSIAYQNVPDNVLWCVLNDGNLTSFTYEPKEEVVGWATHSTSATTLITDLQIVRIGGKQYPIVLGNDENGAYVMSNIRKVVYRDATTSLVTGDIINYSFTDNNSTTPIYSDTAYMDFASDIYISGLPLIGKMRSIDIQANGDMHMTMYKCNENPLIAETISANVLPPVYSNGNDDIPNEIYNLINIDHTPLEMTLSGEVVDVSGDYWNITTSYNFPQYANETYEYFDNDATTAKPVVTQLYAGSLDIVDDNRVLSEAGARIESPVMIPERAVASFAYGYPIESVIDTLDITSPQLGVDANIRINDPAVVVRNSGGGTVSITSAGSIVTTDRLVDDSDTKVKSAVIERSTNGGMSAGMQQDSMTLGSSIRIEHDDALPLNVLSTTVKITTTG